MSGTAGRNTPVTGSAVAASPRTPAAPMAFTTRELHRGAAKAGLWFLVLLYPAICGYVFLDYLTGVQPFAAVSGPGEVILATLFYGVFGIVLGCVAWVPGALAALLIGTPVAYVLGRLLERTRSVWIHVLAFAIFGLILGEVVAVATLWIEGWDGGDVALLAITSVPLALAGAGAVCLGWRSAYLRGMKDDLELSAAT